MKTLNSQDSDVKISQILSQKKKPSAQLFGKKQQEEDKRYDLIYGAMESLIGPEEVDPEVISLFKTLEAEQ